MMNEQTIFTSAIEQDASRRAAFLDEVCGADHALRRRVEQLIRLHDGAGSFLEHPAADVAETVGEPLLERPGSRIGPYQLLEQLGEGGMGAVYLADQKEPVRRKVALKVIKPGMDTRQVVARFEAERQALAMMNHPNVAKVLDAGATETGKPYFVMELVKGLPITEFCDQHQLSTDERLALFITVCQAVQHAHQKGLIHRDLKPSNVLVEMHDVIPVPKVIDFGIAKAIGHSLTEKTLHTAFSQLVGTPLYMSPEQAGQSSIDVDTRSDIYSLGVLLYEILTGSTPSDRDTLEKAGFDEMRRMIREVDPPRPSARISTLQAHALSTVSDRRQKEPRKLSQLLRGELDWIVMKALEKDRTRRYETANGFAADVQRYLDDEPHLALALRIR
jgi:eukaryotic-like serine/threonine-protein kinase